MSDKKETQKKETVKTDAATTEQAGIPIQILSQYVKDFSFENPNAPAVFSQMKSAPNVAVNVNVEARKMGDDGYEVSLVINGNATNEAGDKYFVAELVYCALVALKDVPEEAVKPILLIEVPRMIFPFARNIMADMTREGGYPPLMINPVDFVSLYKKGMEQANQAAASGQSGTA